MNCHGSMNRIYKLVWSLVRNTWVVAAETARGRGKGAKRKLVATVLSLAAVSAQAGPVDGQLTAGTGSITQTGSTTTIVQTSPHLALNWQSFNVAPGETVNFEQPSVAAIAVNRIFDTNGTRILGQLNANGQVWLINPNGILFGQGAQIDVGGLVASTLNLSDTSLTGNTHSFSGDGAGSVVNRGTITTASGGYAALLGNTVSNQGTISAQLGTVALGAGSAATLTFSDNTLVNLQVDQSLLNALADNGGLLNADGGMVLMNAGAKNALLASVVNNSGIIEARTVENHAGVITLLGGMTAGTVNVGGTLDASAPNGGNGGFIETSAAHVKIANATRVTTAASAGEFGTWLIDPQDYTVAASGGDITGTLLSDNLGTTSINLQSSAGGTAGAGNVNVNATVTWSANTTLTLTASHNVNINAPVTATGNTAALVIAPNTANGTETASGTGIYNLNNGAAITLSGTNPGLTIAGTAYTVINALGAMGSTTGTDLQGMRGNLSRRYALGTNIDATATSTWNGGAGFIPVGQSNAMFTGTLDGLGHSITNLTINFPGSLNIGLFGYVGSGGTLKNVGLVGGSVIGHSTVGALAGMNNGGSISSSYATGTVTSAGTGTVGGLVGYNFGSINSSYATGAVSGAKNVGGLVGFSSSSTGISDSYATGTVTGTSNVGGLVGYVSNLGTVRNSHYNMGTVLINGVTSHVTPYGLYNSQYLDWFNNNKVLNIASYAATLPLNGSYYLISSTQGLKDMLGFTDNSTYKFRLTTNLDLTAVAGWHIPYFAGAEFDGAGYALNKLAINQPNDRIGFIGMLASTSLLRNLGLTNVNVTGNGYIGALVGEQYGTISNNYTTGAVTGGSYVGGLVGINQSGTISNSHSTAVLTGDIYIGGLVGLDYGDISNSYATGTVTGGEFGIGGLVGEHDGGNISNSYATGTVSGTDYGVGGLVGARYGGDITDSYATGAVSGIDAIGGLVGYNDSSSGITSDTYATGTVSGDQNVGGLVGSNYGAISNSYTTGTVAGADYVGGLVGYNDNDGGFISTSYAAGSVTGSGDYIGGLVGDNSGGTISNSYATGAVSGNDKVGGLVGSNDYDSTGVSIINTYSAGSVTGSGSAVGGLAGFNGGTISNSFWDLVTSGLATSDGGTSMRTIPMQQQSNFTSATTANGNVNPGWDFTSIWRMYENHTYPLLQVFLRPFSITVNSAANKVYNGIPFSSGNHITCSGGGCSDSHLFNTSGFLGTALGATNVGSYTLISDTFSDQQGYNITFLSGTLNITPAPLSVTASNLSRFYGQANPALNVTVSGFVNGETAGTAAGYGGTGSASTTAVATTNAGTAVIAVSTGNLVASNYNFTAANSTLTINKIPLTVTAADASRFYGQANPVFNTAVSGFINGESASTAAGFAGAGSATTTAGPGTNVGTVPITAGAGSLSATNYSFTNLVDGVLSINKAQLMVTAADATRLYGQANPVFSTTVSGFVNGETAGTAAGFTGTGSATSTATATTNAGTALITAGVGNLVATNYDFTTLRNGTLTINKAHLTVSADDKNRLYGQANPVLTSTVSGFVNGETAGTAAGFAGAGNATSTATVTTNAGTALITAGAGNLSASNYDFTARNGTLTINKARLTVTANDNERLFGQPNPVLGTTVSGFANGETAATASGFAGVGVATSAADATTPVGKAVITAGAGTLVASNYTFTTLVDGTLTINSARPPEPVEIATSQVVADVASFRIHDSHQMLLLSPTIGEEANAYLQDEVVVDNKETRINIGGLGPTLQIVNGGVNFLDNVLEQATEQEVEQDAELDERNRP